MNVANVLGLRMPVIILGSFSNDATLASSFLAAVVYDWLETLEI